MLKVPVIVPDFPLDFAVFFPSGKIRYMKGKSGTSRGKSSETTGGFPWQTAPKLHSSLVLCTFYRGTRRSPRPPPLPPPARPGPGSHPGPFRIPARPSQPTPAQGSGASYRIFPGLSIVLSSGHTGFFPRVKERGNTSVQTEKTHLLH